MLDLLIKYARDHELVTEPGFKPKLARWGLIFDKKGRFQHIQELGDPEAKKNPGQLFDRCPDLTQPEMIAVGEGCRHFLLDSANVVTLYDGGKGNDDKARLKHDYFVNLLRQASSVLPVLEPIADFLSSSEKCASVNEELARRKARPTENVTLAVIGDAQPYLVDRDDWHDWWRSFRRSIGGESESGSNGRKAASEEEFMLCFATGERVRPTPTHPKIEGLSDVGGLAMGNALVCFDKEAFRSFGLEQSANGAMSEAAASTYRAALNHLIRNHGHKLANVKVVHWYAGKVPLELDPLGRLEEPNVDLPIDVRTEAVAQSKAGKLLDSILSAQREDILRFRFYALSVSANSGRVVIRDWIEGQFEDLVRCIDAWFEDLSIIRRDGAGLAPPPKLLAVVGATVRELGDAPAPMITRLWHVAARNEPIPDSVAAQALARVKVDMLDPDAVPNHARYGLLKAYVIRKGDRMAATLREDWDNPAYQCGRLMALLAKLQFEALGDVGASVVQRYYAAASATPALVLGRLLRTAQFHLDKVRADRPKLASWFDAQLASVAARVDPTQLPTSLSLHQQCLFALGYYQQKAHRKQADNSDSPTEDVSTN